MLTTTQITEAIAQWVLSISDNPLVFLLLANLFLLFVGCFMETIAAITILVPVFMPIIAKLGIDPVHFGLVMVLNLMIGLLTPPVGMVLFVLQKVAKISFEATVKAVLPWLWPLLATLALITYVPQLVLWLPGILYREVGDRVARIDRVEILQVDLPPKVVRTDAIQAFVTQETPIVRITCDDGAEGTGYTYTIGTGGSSVVALLRDHLAPKLARPRSRCDRGDLEGPLLPHARDGGRRDHEPRAGRDRHRAVGPALQARPGCRCGRSPAARSRRCPSTRPKAAGCTCRPTRSSRRRSRRKAQGFRGAKLKVGKPHVSEDVARLRAVREAVGDAFEIMVDANQCFTVSEAIRRARAFEPFGLAWLEEPLPAEDLGGHVELAAHTAIPIAVGESLYHPAHFREYLERDACSIVQVDGARIGGITPWLKVAHLAETLQRRGLPAFPDGAARVAHGGRAERRLGRVHPAARRPHDVAARDRRRLRDRAVGAGSRHRLGLRARSTGAPSRGRRSGDRRRAAAGHSSFPIRRKRHPC